MSMTDDLIAQELDAYLHRLSGRDVFSGAVLLARHWQPIYKNAFGLANRDFEVPNRIDTRFNIGSMNKMFTAVAIAQLVERGELSFDDQLSKYIPEFPNKEASEKIRIKHLLTHTSGLFGPLFGRKFNRFSKEIFRTIDSLMGLAKGEELVFEPGTGWKYSNTGFLVLGKVVETITGRSYYDYVSENIYRPAGMANTDCYHLDQANPNLAIGYEKVVSHEGIYYKINLFRHVIRGGPAAGGYSTVEDLLKFDQALRSYKLGAKESVDLLLAPKPELNSPEYGFGFFIEHKGQVAGHPGTFPGVSSQLLMFLGTGHTFVVLSNYSRGREPVVKKLASLILELERGSQLPPEFRKRLTN
jgi:CubicO group peptidase (beta-lactamase class C family)